MTTTAADGWTDARAGSMRIGPRRSLALLVLLALIGTARTAVAQGTDGAFSDPLSFDELTALLEPLGLSDGQRAAVLTAHGAYLDGVRVLRQGAIEAYLGSFRSVPFEHAGDRERIVDGTKRRRAILREIDGLDAALFARMDAALTDEQRATLPRLVDRRTRARMAMNPSSLGWQLPSLRALDLTDAVRDIEVEPAKRAEVDGLLAAYESAITPIYRRIHDQRLDLPLAYHDRTWEARKAFEEQLEAIRAKYEATGPEDRKGYEEAISLAFARNPEAGGMADAGLPEMEPIRKDLARISRLDRRLLEDLRGVLPAPDVDRVASRLARRAFATLAIPRDPLRRRVERRLDDETTDTEMREALTALYEQYLATRRTLVTKMVSAAEEAGFAGGGAMMPGWDAEEAAAHDRPIDAARTDLRSLNERTLAAYARLTGEEIAARPRAIRLGGGDDEGLLATLIQPGEGEVSLSLAVDVSTAEGDAPDVGGAIVFVGELDSAERTAIPFVMSGDVSFVVDGDVAEAEPYTLTLGNALPGGSGRWLPGPTTAAEYAAIVDRLELADDKQPVADWLHQDYVEAFAALDESTLQPARRMLRDAARAANDGSAPPDPGAARAAVAAAMEAALALDAKLLADLAAVADGDEVGTVVDQSLRTRKRSAYAQLRAANGGYLRSGSREDRVDLMAIVSALESGGTALADGDSAACRTALAPYDLESVGLFEARWQADLDAAQARAEHVQSAMREAEPSGVSYTGFIRGPDGESSGPSLAAARVREANRHALDALGGKVSDVAFTAVRKAYLQAAFPSLVAAPGSVQPMLERAAELELGSKRRHEIDELRLEHRAASTAILSRMIALVRAYEAAAASSDDAATFERFRALQRNLETERFDRRNLDERAEAALRDILGDEDAARIGLAAE